MIYFDNAATTYPKPGGVIRETNRTIKKCGGNVPAYAYFVKILRSWYTNGIITFEKAREETSSLSNKKNLNKNKKLPNKDTPDWLYEYVDKFESKVEDL